MSELEKQQLEEYERRGVLVIERFLPEELLDAAVVDAERIVGTVLQKPVPFHRAQDLWTLSEPVAAIATDETVRGILRTLYGREPLPFQTLNFDVPTQQPVHSDTIHFNSLPRGLMCGVWIALEDVSLEQGPLIYYPGSHKLPEYTFQDFDLEPGFQPEPVREFQARLDQVIKESELEPEYGVVSKGSVVIWASNLLHGGHEWRDKSRTRHSQVTHYFFEGSQYWRPGLSGDERFYFEPEWIPC